MALVEPKLNECGLFRLPPLPAMFHCSCFGPCRPIVISFFSFFVARFSGSCAVVASGIAAETKATRRDFIARPAISTNIQDAKLPIDGWCC